MKDAHNNQLHKRHSDETKVMTTTPEAMTTTASCDNQPFERTNNKSKMMSTQAPPSTERANKSATNNTGATATIMNSDETKTRTATAETMTTTASQHSAIRQGITNNKNKTNNRMATNTKTLEQQQHKQQYKQQQQQQEQHK